MSLSEDVKTVNPGCTSGEHRPQPQGGTFRAAHQRPSGDETPETQLKQSSTQTRLLQPRTTASHKTCPIGTRGSVIPRPIPNPEKALRLHVLPDVDTPNVLDVAFGARYSRCSCLVPLLQLHRFSMRGHLWRIRNRANHRPLENRRGPRPWAICTNADLK